MRQDAEVPARLGPLNGWRAIATYMGRNQSTVKRWASDRGLPVHRPEGGTARKGVPVYAFAEELDAWLRGHRLDRFPPTAEGGSPAETLSPTPGIDNTDACTSPATALPAMLKTDRAGWSRRAAINGGLGLSLVLLTGAGWWWRGRERETAAMESPSFGDARSLYNRGLYYMNLRTSEGLSNATTLFKNALALEPNFIDAAAALAQAYNLSAQYAVLPPEEAYPLALATARDVLSRAPGHAAGLAALAFATFYWLRDFPASYDLFERALKHDPDSADVHHWYALAIMHDRKFDIAIREIEAAQRLSPVSPSILANKALILHHAGRHEEALAILEPLAKAQPGLLSAVSYLATIYLDIRRDRDFVASYGQAANLLGDAGRKEIAEAASRGLALAGRPDMLSMMLAVQTRLFEEGRERAFKVAITAAYLERPDLTLDYLELAIRRNEPDVLGVRLELPDELLNRSPRYAELVTQIGFSGASNLHVEPH